jgi:hypothetical protein
LASAPAPHVVVERTVSADPHENAATRDVSVLPDGSYALVRRDGSPFVNFVDLRDNADPSRDPVPIMLAGPVTDLDLVPDSQSALAVVRGDAAVSAPDADNAGAGGDSAGASNSGPTETRSTLAILPIPGIFEPGTPFDTVSIDEVFGLVNIAPQGSIALLYTNAVANSHLTLLQTAPGKKYLSYRTLDLRGNVHEVFPSPDGAYAIASLVANDASGKPGFAAVPVATELPVRVQTTDAPVFAVAQSSGPAARAVVTVSDGKANFSAYIVRMPELVIDQVKLPSRPLAGATGLVPDAGVAYIAEEHPQGRITFINLETGVPRTITGFEIAAKVTNGN